MNHDRKIKYVSSDLFLIGHNWLLQNNLFKIGFADWAMSASTGVCNTSKLFLWMSFFCTNPELPVVGESIEHLKNTLNMVIMWFSIWWSAVSDKGCYSHDRWVYISILSMLYFAWNVYSMNKLPSEKKFPIIFSHSPCNFLSFSKRPAK